MDAEEMENDRIRMESVRVRSALRTVQALAEYANSVSRTSQPEIVSAISHLLNSIPDDEHSDRIFETARKPGVEGAIVLRLDANGLGVRVEDMVEGELFPFVLFDVDENSIRANADLLLRVLDREVQEKIKEAMSPLGPLPGK